jgi:hypothetical protein
VKHDDARSISMMNTAVLDWFMPSRAVIVIRSVFAIKFDAPNRL